MADNVRFLSNEKDDRGRFAKGNPGRPKGAKGKKSREALEQVKSFGPDALQKLWEALNAGDRWAIQFVLDKILPMSRTIQLEDVTPEDVTEALKEGDITAAEAKDIATALAKLTEIAELQDIKLRLESLEKVAHEKR